MPWNSNIVGTEILAVHAALVPSGEEGEVLLFGGDEHWSAQQESAGGDQFKKTRIYDIKTHSLVSVTVPSPDSDVFCSAHAFAADGRLLIGGGTSKWPESVDVHMHGLDFLGHRRCWLYNPHRREWVEVARMNTNPDQPDEEHSGGRWYPSLVTLGNGDIVTFFGHPAQQDSRHRNTLPERYRQGGNTWFHLPKEMAYPIEPGGAVRYLFYARAFTLPDGMVFFATPMPVDFESAVTGDGTYFTTRYNPATGDYNGPKIPGPGFGGYLDWSRPAVLLPLLPDEDYRARVLFCGDTNAQKIDLGSATPAWQNTATRDASVATRTREYSNAVILPNGEVCLVGGVNQVDPEDPVLQAEIYNPGINWSTGAYSNPDSWLVKESATHARNYHSTALLLPNGKVWVAGGNTNAHSGNPDSDITVNGVNKKLGIKEIELYEPDYIDVANRMQITQAPSILAYGEPFEVGIDRPATSVQRVALVRNGSVTHSTNNDQRYVGLQINAKSGNTLQLTAPPNGNIAPPGYYMLWVVDSAGNPCQQAAFIRVARLECEVITDRSTFSEEEVLSLGGGGQTTFANAIYVKFDGFIHTELTGNPSFALTWADTNVAIATSDLILVPDGKLLEVDPGHPDIPQRITFPFKVRFLNMNVFSTFPDRRQVRVSFTLGYHMCTQTLDLVKAPNPYMIDTDPSRNNPHWLSTDVRVFKILAGETKFTNLTQGNGGNAPHDFIKSVLDKFNNAPNNNAHPFLSISPDQDASVLDLATEFMGVSVYNYAVAKVRYRANMTVAQAVKVFFRSFNSVGTALEYKTSTTYRHTGPGPNTRPLLGTSGGELASIPFFVGSRVETVQGQPGATAMTTQALDPAYEVKNIQPTPGVEVTMYFGCWLDINRTTKRFPINPAGNDGPWPDVACKSIQELMRGRHQCLVAEVYFEPDPTSAGETPGSSDNISQRNLAILHSDNPGGPDSHTVVHTFEVKPSSVATPINPLIENVGGPGLAQTAGHKRGQPDELLFRWHNLPKESEVTLHFSDIDTADIMRFAILRLSPVAFTAVDKHTIRFKVADIAWLPLPGGRTLHIPALLSVKLPDTVSNGQLFHLSVHQVDGMNQAIIGAFEISIPVTKAPLILDEETRTLSVMKHIATTIPPSNRWYPIFQLYVHHLSNRVTALGGKADAVHPNPNGSGKPYVPVGERPKDECPKECKGRDERPERRRYLEGCALGLAFVLLSLASRCRCRCQQECKPRKWWC